MKNKILLLASLFLVFFIISCNNSDNSEETLIEPTEEEWEKISEEDGDIIPDDFLEVLNKAPIVHLKEEDLELPNGLKFSDFHITLEDLRWKASDKNTRGNPSISSTEAKNVIIKSLTNRALALTKRENYIKPNEGRNSPAQNGLAYVFGSREITKRSKYTATKCLFSWLPCLSWTPCNEELYGVDCSGYIYRIFNDSYIPLEKGTVRHYQTLTPIENALKKAFPDYDLEVKNLGKIPMKDFEPGDLVLWKNKIYAFHMGLVIKRGEIFLANSAGGRKKCVENKSKDGGPVTRDYAYIDKSLKDTYDYDVIRISVPNAWILHSRCIGGNDFQKQTIPIDKNNSSEVKHTFYFTDSNRILRTEMLYTYDKVKNIINGTTSTYDDKNNLIRSDRYSLPVVDNGEYHAIDPIKAGGCRVEMRLSELKDEN